MRNRTKTPEPPPLPVEAACADAMSTLRAIRAVLDTSSQVPSAAKLECIEDIVCLWEEVHAF